MQYNQQRVKENYCSIDKNKKFTRNSCFGFSKTFGYFEFVKQLEISRVSKEPENLKISKCWELTRIKRIKKPRGNIPTIQGKIYC